MRQSTQHELPNLKSCSRDHEEILGGLLPAKWGERAGETVLSSRQHTWHIYLENSVVSLEIVAGIQCSVLVLLCRLLQMRNQIIAQYFGTERLLGSESEHRVLVLGQCLM